MKLFLLFCRVLLLFGQILAATLLLVLGIFLRDAGIIAAGLIWSGLIYLGYFKIR